MLYLVSHTAALILLAVVLWLPGWVLTERWVGRRPVRARLAALRPLASVCLGLACWIMTLFALAATGLLHLPATAVVTVSFAAAALWTRWRRNPGEQPTRKKRRRCHPPTRTAVLVVAGLAAVLTPLYLLAISPVVSWDADVYHLTVPKLYLDHQGFRPIDFNVYSNWPLAIELLYALAMAVQDHVLAKLVHFGFGLLTLWAIYITCRSEVRRAGPGAGKTCGFLAMALFLANPVVAYELHVAYVELAHAFFLITGFLFMNRALGKTADTPQALLLAGICGGVTAGIKLNGIVGAAILGCLYLPRLVRASKAGELAATLRDFGLRFVLPVFCLWLPWLLKSTWTTGNPIYPFLLGGPQWTPELSEALTAWHRSHGMGREPLDYLLLPVRVILMGGRGYPQFDGVVGAFWIVLLPLSLWACRRPLVRRCLLVAGVHFVFWAMSSQQTRLLVPVLPLLAVAGAVAVVDLAGRLPSSILRAFGRRLALLAALALAAWYGTGAVPGISRSKYLGSAGNALGRYLAGGDDLLRSAVHPVWTFIDRDLPADARLLFLNTNRGFFCDREYVADSFFEASQIAAWLAPAGGDVGKLRELLAEEGISHLLVHPVDWGIPYPPALFAMLRDPSQVEQVYRSPDGRFSVLSLNAELSP